MDSEDMRFILYTSGFDGKPKGAWFIYGGYMVIPNYSFLQNVFPNISLAMSIGVR